MTGETVAAYNARHPGKAWRIVAMTMQGAGYCAECVGYWPVDGSGSGDWVEYPVPVFASDELYGDPCDLCGVELV